MRLLMKVIIGLMVLLILMSLGLIVLRTYYQKNGRYLRKFDDKITLLKSSGPYISDTVDIRNNYVVEKNRASEIIEYFQLKNLYGPDDSTWEKALAISRFVATSVPHGNPKIYPQYVNAIGLWEYTKAVSPLLNCRLHSILAFELLMAAGIKTRYIACMPHDSEDHDCHVVNEVWLPELEKWVMIDTDMGGHYISDTFGKPLSISEIRNCLIRDEKVIVYSGFSEECFDVNEYYAYLAKNMYWFSRWGDYGFFLEDYMTVPETELRQAYYALVPVGYTPFGDVKYTITHDAEQFWK